MIKSIKTIFACDFCGIETVVQDEADNRRFEAEWHTSLKLDLCPLCKESPRGKAKILIEWKTVAQARANANLKG